MPSSRRGREQVERHDLALRLRARDPRAVERGGGVALAQAADEDVLAVLHADAADPLHRLARRRCRDSSPICSAVIALTMLAAFRCSSSARFTVPRSASALTEISASWTASATSATSCATVPPCRHQRPRSPAWVRIRSSAPAATPGRPGPTRRGTGHRGPTPPVDRFASSSTVAPATGAPCCPSTTRPTILPRPCAESSAAETRQSERTTPRRARCGLVIEAWW